MKQFLVLKAADEARRLLESFPAIGAQTVPLGRAAGRVLCEDVIAPSDLPPWPRSVMDGYAVRAQDTAGASESVPTFAKVKGTVPMGGEFKGALGPGDVVGISTGGVMPEGADAVVMIEYTQPGEGDEIALQKSVAPWDNAIQTGEDIKGGTTLLSAGKRLRAHDVGLLSAFGIVEVPVHRKPVVAILSTGTELVAPEATPARGQIRCMNQHTLGAKAAQAGAEVIMGGIVIDEHDQILARSKELIEKCDMLLLSGGSSVGVRDLTAQVLDDLGAETMLHGISVRPGKPTIVARLGDKPILGMPGVPLSAMIIFDVFVRPLLWRIAGEPGKDPWPMRKRARMQRQVASVAGREDYIRVRVTNNGDETIAEPLIGGSAITSTLLFADGLVKVDALSEGLAQDERVEVLLFE